MQINLWISRKLFKDILGLKDQGPIEYKHRYVHYYHTYFLVYSLDTFNGNE